MSLRLISSLLLVALIAVPAEGQSRPTGDSALVRSLMTELIAIPSVSGTRETVRASEAIVARLRAAGFSATEAFVTGSADSIGNVVVRLRGKSQALKPCSDAPLDVGPHS